MRGKAQQGFTLIELLVALSIFTLIGLGAHTMLQSVLRSREVTQAHAQQLTRLQKAVWIMTQDAMQMEPDSATIPGGDYMIRFVRGGWRNPMALPRGNRLSVAYGLSGTQLMRYYWPAGQETAPQKQALLEDVSDLQFHPMPQAMEWTMHTRSYGPLRRVVEVPGP